MNRFVCSLCVVLISLAVLHNNDARGDSVELTNGDKLNGRVLSVDSKTLKLKSDTLGQISVSRAKVATIHLGDAPANLIGKRDRPDRSAPRPNQPTGKDVRPSEAQLVKELRARGLNVNSLDELRDKVPPIKLPVDSQPSRTPADVVQQLRTRGLRPGAIEEVQTKVPLLAVPGVRSYFNRTLEGLFAGELGISDLRRDAIKARDGLRDLQQDLGPDAAALDGYMMILDGFIERTAPSKPKASRR